jgi:hypothetical protein
MKKTKRALERTVVLYRVDPYSLEIVAADATVRANTYKLDGLVRGGAAFGYKRIIPLEDGHLTREAAVEEYIRRCELNARQAQAVYDRARHQLKLAKELRDTGTST